MTDILPTGTLSGLELTQLIHACNFQPHARFIGEQLPEHIVDETEQKNLLIFTWYRSNIPFTSYSTGRIFHLDGELRWERSADMFQIVYLGSAQYEDMLIAHHCTIQPDFTTLIDNKQLKKIPKQYFLFGKFLQEDPKLIATPENHLTYAEARIPRLLHYPLHRPAGQQNKERVQIHVTEYVCEESGSIFAYRFQDLQTMTDTSKSKGA